MSSIVFDNLFEDQDWMDAVVLVSLPNTVLPIVNLFIRFFGPRSDTTCVDTGEAVNPLTKRPGSQNDWQKISTLSLRHSVWSNHLSLDGKSY